MATFDDKDLTVDDIISLREFGHEESFASARITSVITKPFSDLTADDFEGHEPFQNDQQMYDTYSQYYKREVNQDTIVKIIRFELFND